MKMVTIKEMKQNLVILRTVNRQLKHANTQIVGHPKNAERIIAQSQGEIGGVVEWLEKKCADSN